MKRKLTQVLVIFVVLSTLVACGSPAPGTQASAPTTGGEAAVGAAADSQASTGATKITIGGYTTPREAIGKIIPLFQKSWKDQTGQDVTFEQSYLGSGAQSRAIVDGFDADIAILSLEADITRIEKAGLITHDWKAAKYGGMMSTSVVAFAVRPGNPKGIKDWADLAKPEIEVLTPNPATSGGAQWNIMALYGAAYRGSIPDVPKGDDAAAKEFLKHVLGNVSVMDKGARESITTFEKGVGDVAITYENEVLVAQQAGEEMDLVIPPSTILIENPVALIDTYVEKHGNRTAVEAFINFLFTPEAQKIFAETGLRAVDPDVAKENASRYPAVADQFTIKDFGGWGEVSTKFFGDSGIYTAAIAEVQK